MLPRIHRLTTSDGFRRAVRGGRRSGGRLLVVHLARPESLVDTVGATEARGASAPPARVGFVVSKAVGNAVVRNRVQRRLRHLCRARLNRLSPGCTLVVRALPAAAGASYVELGRELDRAIARVLESVAEKANEGRGR